MRGESDVRPFLRAPLVALLCLLPTHAALGQQAHTFGVQDTVPPASSHSATSTHPAASDSERPLAGTVDERLKAMDSVVYRLAPSSRLQVKTGKAGLFGFAGHTHLIQADAFDGEVVYYPREPSRSRIEITVRTDSLEVLTPPDTAEIRKVTETMRAQVLRTAEYPAIRLVARQVVPTANGFHIIAALTLVGQTRELPIDVTTRLGLDSLEAASTFAVKQSAFGIKPFSGGPGGTVKVADRVTFDIRIVAVRPRP
jgi:polyisoprenoid-binding protein YceI